MKKFDSKKVPTKENLAIKYKVMLGQINRLEKYFILIPYNDNSKKLDSIKKKYVRSYGEMLEQERFDTYIDIEKFTIQGLAILEYDLDKYIFENKLEIINIIKENVKAILDLEKYKNIIFGDGTLRLLSFINRKAILNPEDFKNCTNIDKMLSNLQAVKDIYLKISPYMDEIQRDELLQQILKIKFELLYKMQKLVLFNEEANKQYPFKGITNREELELYHSIINEKLQAFRELNINDDILELEANEILKNASFLNRLLILEIYHKPNEHIDLLTMPMFNIHKCTLISFPDDRIKYATELGRGWYKYKVIDWYRYRINTVLLYGIMSNILTDDKVSLVECDRLFRRFDCQFGIVPENDLQKLMYAVYHKLKDTSQYKSIYDRGNSQTQNEKYFQMQIKAREINRNSYPNLGNGEKNKWTIVEEQQKDDLEAKKKAVLSEIAELEKLAAKKNSERKTKLEEMQDGDFIHKGCEYNKILFEIKILKEKLIKIEEQINPPSFEKLFEEYSNMVEVPLSQTRYGSEKIWSSYEDDFKDLKIRAKLIKYEIDWSRLGRNYCYKYW